ncbi:Sensor protein QseC [compost metagenome]
MEVTVNVKDGALLIRVRDHGPGVAAEHLARLGEPFFRAPNQSGAGHGLGLAIARRAVERHGGSLDLGNHPEGGFIATLELPAALKA